MTIERFFQFSENALEFFLQFLFLNTKPFSCIISIELFISFLTETSIHSIEADTTSGLSVLLSVCSAYLVQAFS